MTQPLDGRRILVTGGATGIGAAAVQALKEAGASVVATYHRTPPPEQAGVSWVQCDVRDAAAVDAMVTGAAETLGGLDVLLHAAGLWQPGIPGQITGEDIDFLADTNVKATIFTNQAAYAVMRKDGGGRIINFGSGEAVMGSPISALYAATKGAVAERSATRCATSGRCWYSSPARDPASSTDG
jgi:NAD(P)-dependent dehydrogenase (short-subunit alcohol dehydrogenase family)